MKHRIKDWLVRKRPPLPEFISASELSEVLNWITRSGDLVLDREDVSGLFDLALALRRLPKHQVTEE